MPRITAPFTIGARDSAPAAETPWSADAAGPVLGRVTLRTSYAGALDGEATVDILTCVADPADMALGAVCTALEQFSGRLDGREGTFVVQHRAAMGAEADPGDPAGAVAPGSGALAGLRGTAAIHQGPDGHTLTLDYTLP